jgi:cyanate permease
LRTIWNDALFWFAVLGFVTFVFVIPIVRKAREAYEGRPEIPE